MATNKSGSAARTLDPETQAAVGELLRAIKRAPDLRSLAVALRALPRAGAAGEAAARLVNSGIIPTFGGKRPSEEMAFSWSREEMLCAGDDGMFAPVLLPRPADEPPVSTERPVRDRSAERPRGPTGDATEPAENDATEAPESPAPSHDSTEAAAVIQAALERQRVKVVQVGVKLRTKGATILVKYEDRGRAHTMPFEIPADGWAMPLAELASELAESFAQRGEDA